MSLDAALSGTVVVTGAASGIGRALVSGLAAKGARRLVAADLDFAGAERTAIEVGESVQPLSLDVADEAAVSAAADALNIGEEPITAWFSNAGIQAGAGLGSTDDWKRSLSVNLLAHVHAARAVLPAMEDAGHGAFVITASAAGLLMDPRTATYTATKHAAVGFAEWLAAGVAAGVAIHCVCPEGVRTAMTTATSAASGVDGFLSADEVAATVLQAIEAGEFLVLTHAHTAEYERRRCGDRGRWLQGMRRARERSLRTDRLFPNGTFR